MTSQHTQRGFAGEACFISKYNNLFNTEFPIRIITIATTFVISSGLRPQSPPDLASISTICYTCHEKGFSVHFANFTAGEFENLNASLPLNT